MMKQLIQNTVKGFVLIPLLLISMTISAQDTSDYENAKNEIIEQFGSFFPMFEAYPKYALAEVWENFKKINGPDSNIPPKYRELIQLAVASQIPCEYCVYFHKASAKANGATDEEIKEAVAHGAQTRHWSMIIQSSGISIEDFKTDFDAAMKHMSEKAKQ